MEVLLFILLCIIAVFAFILLAFILASCKVSGNCDEEYQKLDPKILDDERKWEEDIYDENFVKKEDANEKRDNLGK